MSNNNKKDTPSGAFFNIVCGVGIYLLYFGLLEPVDPVWRWMIIVFGPLYIWNGIISLFRLGGGWIAWGVITMLTIGLASAALSVIAITSHYSEKKNESGESEKKLLEQRAAPSEPPKPNTYSEATENAYFVCTPLRYREKWFDSGAKELDCRSKDVSIEECKPTRVDMSELKADGGFYTFVIEDDPKSSDPGQVFRLSRADGSYTHRITIGETMTATYTGTCQLLKEILKF